MAVPIALAEVCMPPTRRFIEADLDPLKTLVDRTLDVSYADFYPPEAIAFFKDYHSSENILNDAAAGHTLVIEDGSKLIATGTLLQTNVRRMFVDPAAQGHGLGHALLSKLEEHAVTLGLTILDVSSSLPAHPFYLRHGYVTDSEEAIRLPGGEVLRYYAMSKTLESD